MAIPGSLATYMQSNIASVYGQHLLNNAVTQDTNTPPNPTQTKTAQKLHSTSQNNTIAYPAETATKCVWCDTIQKCQ